MKRKGESSDYLSGGANPDQEDRLKWAKIAN